jgi:spermidine synthase
VAAGFYLLPQLGLAGTLASAVALNAVVALAAILLGLFGRTEVRVKEIPSNGEGHREPLPARERLVLWAFLVSGALALALEVLWTRSLLLVFGSTVYSFSTMLAIFLLGLALGGAAMGSLADRLKYPTLALALVEMAIGAITLVSVARINGLPSAFLDGLIRTGFTWGSYMGQKALIAGGILFPVAFLFGATFTLVAKVEVFRERGVGGQVGLLYAFNTVGAILGSLGAGFVLLPWLGLQRSLTLVALCAFGVGAVLFASGAWPIRRSLRAALAAGLVLAGGLGATLVPSWDTRVLSAGVYFHPNTYLSPDGKQNLIDQVLGSLRVKEYVEGLTETAAVVDTPISRMFLVDGKVEASTRFDDMRLQRLQGHLPMLLTPRHGKAINIGLGCGITLGALKVYPLDSFQCVELEKKILNTARAFSEANHSVLDDPRLQIILNDGRNHLLLTDEKYDVITSDPFEPLVGGAASLYTEDHFRNGKARLTKGGLFCQYLPMYQLSPDDFRMIIRSFCRVYPHVTFWYTGIDTILVGSNEPQIIDLKELRRRMAIPGVRESLAGIGITDPAHLLQTFVCDPGKLPEIEGPGLLNTDRNPRIEFSAPRSHLVNTTPMNLRWLMANRHPEDLPLDRTNPEAGAVAEKASAVGILVMEASLGRFESRYPDALEAGRKARAIDPANRAVLYEIAASDNLLADRLLAQGKGDEAKPLLDEALASGEQPLDTFVGLATWAFNSNKPEEARGFIENALVLNPAVPDVVLKMALCLKELGRTQEAMAWCNKALALNPKLLQARFTKADLCIALGDQPGALAVYRDLVGSSPGDMLGQDWLAYGELLAGKNLFPEARKALDRAVALTPNDPRAWYTLARVAKLQGDRAAAQAALNRASALAPEAVKSWLTHDPILGVKE